MSEDVTADLHGATVQHGPFNDRAYLMKLGKADPEKLIAELDGLAAENGYSKIFAKVPEGAAAPFEAAGYIREAFIPGPEEGGGMVFLGRFLAEDRASESDWVQLEDVVRVANDKAGTEPRAFNGYELHRMGQDGLEDMARIYDRVFDSYPFPIHDPDFLRTCMLTNVVFYGAFRGDELCALSSAELDLDAGCAEMTDFATLPEHRGKGLAGALLGKMENDVDVMGVHTFYTIARAVSHGMNVAFSRAGYTLGGTLVKNTNIGGGMESMNVWYKLGAK